MLELRHSKRAICNLDKISEYYEKQSSGLGRGFAKYYNAQISILKSFPNVCRAGIRMGTREMVMHDFPFIIVYRIKDTFIQVVTVYHQKRQQPE